MRCSGLAVAWSYAVRLSLGSSSSGWSGSARVPTMYAAKSVATSCWGACRRWPARSWNTFTATRLVTQVRGPAAHDIDVEVTHEILLRAWPRFRSWLDDDRMNTSPCKTSRRTPTLGAAATPRHCRGVVGWTEPPSLAARSGSARRMRLSWPPLEAAAPGADRPAGNGQRRCAVDRCGWLSLRTNRLESTDQPDHHQVDQPNQHADDPRRESGNPRSPRVRRLLARYRHCQS